MVTRVTILYLFLIISSTMLLGGCGGMSETQRAAVGGAAVGAIGGQVIGRDTNSTLIGAGVGALGGVLLNDSLKR